MNHRGHIHDSWSSSMEFQRKNLAGAIRDRGVQMALCALQRGAKVEAVVAVLQTAVYASEQVLKDAERYAMPTLYPDKP
jgi:hypothetical protein